MAASSSSKMAPESHLGSFISLISKYEVRYEGVLYHLNEKDSTIGLKDVKSYGTEGRKKDGPQVPPSDKIYEYILFRGTDIKDLEVKSSPPSQEEDQMCSDPAIIQSQYAGLTLTSPPSAAFGSKTITDSQWEDTPALTTRTHSGDSASGRPSTEVGPCNLSQATHGVGAPFFFAPMCQHALDCTSTSVSLSPNQLFSFQSPSTVPSLLTRQHVQTSDPSAIWRQTSASGSVAPVSPIVIPTSLYPDFSSSTTPLQCLRAPDMPSLSKTPLPATLDYINNSQPPSSCIPSSCQDTKFFEAPTVGKNVSNLSVNYPAQPMTWHASSFSGPYLSPLPTPSPSLLTPSGPTVVSSMPKMIPIQRDMSAVSPQFGSLSGAFLSVGQAPLLPSATHAQQYPTAQFTEEFDFEAMNEKFKKDELWRYFGKLKQRDKSEDEGHGSGQNLGTIESHGLVNDPSAKPAYKKDDFFDTISCNSHNRGARNGQNRFSDRMKLDNEASGNFQQRPYEWYSGYNDGRGQGYSGTHSGGRGYGYAGRGRGGNMNI